MPRINLGEFTSRCKKHNHYIQTVFMKCFKCGLLVYLRREKKVCVCVYGEGEREAVNVESKREGLSRISFYRLEKSSQWIYNRNFQF